MDTFPCSLFLVLGLLKVTVKTNLVLDDNNHGILSNRIEAYSGNNIPDLHLELSSTGAINSENDLDTETLLKFEPEFLDFQQRPVGIPYLQKVTLFNTDKNQSVDMKSISGNTVHFHSSFFEDKLIPPLGNTTFNVVFLGRDEGAVESDLLIHTANGHFKYKVKGASVSSSYRLRPLVGIKIPQNTTFSPLIYMYNPHIEPIQITEVYSTGDHFHLELLTGETEGPKNMWQIAPLQTKAVIRIKFHSKTEQNHTAYIRFKLNNTENILAVPLEIEVTPHGSLYTSKGFIDFGVRGYLDVPKSSGLYLQNPSKKNVKIDSITSVSKSITIKYETLNVGTEFSNDKNIKVATISLDCQSAYENKEFTGKIVVTYNSGQTHLEIPYYVTVFHGSLLFDPSAMTYFINDFPRGIKTRELFVKNNFSMPLAITNVTLPKQAKKYFYMSDFKMIVLRPQEEASIFTLKLRNDVLPQTLKLNSFIELSTNISTIEVHLLSFNGKLHVEIPYKTKDGLMDLGLIGLDVRKDIYFVINNFNTAVININKITTSLPLAEVEIIHCNAGNYTDAVIRNLTYTINKCGKLELDEFAIIQLTIQSTYMEGQVWGTILIETQYENLTVPVHYKVSQGRIEFREEDLIFDDCFPGKVCLRPLRVHSTFNEPMIIEKIVSIPPDPRLSSEHSGHIMARSIKTLGHLFLNTGSTCSDDCYLGMNFIDTVGWSHTMLLPSVTTELDLKLVKTFYNRYLNVTSNGLKKWHNLTLKLDTSAVKWHIFDTYYAMVWPSVVLNETVLNFPLTQTGGISYFNITLNNPSDHNLVMQLVLSFNYPEFQKLNDDLPNDFFQDYMHFEVTPPNNAFFFNEKLYLFRVLFKTLTGLDAHEATLPILLPPGQQFTFSLGFDAEEPGFKSAFLYVRNNLTIMQVLQLSGRAVVPNFKFGNRKLGSDIPILFELTEKQLKECEQKLHVPNLSVKRSFTARNLGEISILVAGFYINGMPCEGFGYKVLNCERFILLPNSSRKIDIGFTPDLSATQIVRTLLIDTSLSQPVSYKLVGTVPANYLIPCAAAIGRPPWEHVLYYASLVFMSILLICTMGMITADAEYSLKTSINIISRSNASVMPPLDLRQVGAQTRLDIHSNQGPNEDSLQNSTHQEENIIGSNLIGNCTKTLETDKYSVLIPTTGKSKKKLKDGEIEDHQEKHKKSWLEARKLKSKSKELKKSAYLSSKEYKKEIKKQHDLKKSEPEEEETYSVSTDSSNNEEIESLKIIGNRSRLLLRNRNKLTRGSRGEEQSEECYYKEFKKNTRKLLHKNKEKDKLDNKDEELKHKISKSNPSKEYIEKRNLRRKLSLEKKAADKHLPAQSSPLQFTIWGDSKASFSDVVARSDCSPINFVHEGLQPFYKVDQSVPIDTFKSGTDLGPIGSRKTEYIKEQKQDYSNNFSTNRRFGLDNAYTNWNQGVQPTQISHKKEYFQQQQATTLVSGIWNGVNKQGMQNSMDLSTSSSSSHDVGNYLWGSSPVWKPWAPSDIQKPRPRTPPGFVKSSDARDNRPLNQSYDLFSMTNIWAQQYPNLWNSNSGAN